MRLLPIVAGLLVAPGVAPHAATGQSLLAPRFPPTPRISSTTGPSPTPGSLRRTASEPDDRPGPQAEPVAAPALAALLSAVVPGAGQHVLGQRRKWAYLAVETVGWIVYADRRSAAHDLRSRYRDFAWTEARLQAMERIDGGFDYYETMSKWQRSGLFDADPATPSVQPESDESTYNGTIWARAEQLYLQGGTGVPETDARYQSALQYYSERAYSTEFLWDWTGTGTAQQEFGALIRASDDRFRQATNALGFVVVNHLASMVDAFVSARAPATTVRSALVPAAMPGGPVWTTRVDVRTPW